MEIIKKNPDKPWDWDGISRNPNITMEMIENDPDKPWNWKYISINPNLTIEMIENNLDKPWDWEEISNNPNITIEWIDKYPNKPWYWNWGTFSHTFKKDYEKELQKLKNFKNIEEELIQKACHPNRFQEWCLDEDNK